MVTYYICFIPTTEGLLFTTIRSTFFEKKGRGGKDTAAEERITFYNDR
jgi:hypothetical protein